MDQHSPAVPPARPYRRITEDGRRVREVLTYSRRGSRFTPRQQSAWDAHCAQWVIPAEAVDEPGFSVADRFDRDAPLIVEIGCGVGEATAAVASANPDANVLGFEVWRPGVADTLAELAAVGATNARVAEVDAVWAVEHLLAEESVHELLTFFPDPWPKTRHHKRRLVNPRFAHVAALRLRPGATWRLATDWQAYADRMRQVLDDEPLLRGGVTERWPGRPATRFERRGVAAGRVVTDLGYVRRADR